MQLGRIDFFDYVDVDISAGSKAGELIPDWMKEFLPGQTPPPAPAPAPGPGKTIITKTAPMFSRNVIIGAAAAAGLLLLFIATKKNGKK